MKNPQTVASKWVRGMQNAGQSVKDGVTSVTVAPGQKAAAQAELYRRKVNEAVDSGRFARATAAVSLADWQRAMIDKGLAAMTGRAAQSESKVAKFLAFWLPKTEEAKAAVASMPKGGPEEAKARMLRNFEILSAAKYKG